MRRRVELYRMPRSSGSAPSAGISRFDISRLARSIFFRRSVQFPCAAVKPGKHVVEPAVFFPRQGAQKVCLQIDGQGNDLIVDAASLGRQRQDGPSAVQRVDPAIHQAVIHRARDGAIRHSATVSPKRCSYRRARVRLTRLDSTDRR